MNTILYLKNPNTGEIHRVYSDGTGKFSKEVCQLDDTIRLEEITQEDADAASLDDRCGHCNVPDADE